ATDEVLTAPESDELQHRETSEQPKSAHPDGESAKAADPQDLAGTTQPPAKVANAIESRKSEPRKESPADRRPDDVLTEPGGKPPSRVATAAVSDDPWLTQYDAARSIVEHGSLQEALKRFCEIDSTYRDVNDYIQRIGEAIKTQVKRVLQDADKFEQ